MNIDEIVSNEKVKPYNKEEYKEFKNEERQEVYSLADKTSSDVLNSSDMLKKYLDVQAQFSSYSVNNALLIVAQMPEAKVLKSFDDWKKLGVSKKNDAKFIKILEPKKYLRSDNTTSATFNVKKMLDVSQTNMSYVKTNNPINQNEMLSAFLYRCPVSISPTDNLESGKAAEFNKESDVIYVKRGAEPNKIFNDLAYALSQTTSSKNIKENIDNFICNCSAYLICKNMNIEYNNFDFNIPEELKNRDVLDNKEILGIIKDNMEENISRISDFYNNRNQKNKSYER